MSNYNPDTGDWYVGRISLSSDGSLYADVYGTQDYSPIADDLDLSPLFGIMDNAIDAIPITQEFDFQDNHIRGPYDLNQVNRFFSEAPHLKGIVTVYQDTVNNGGNGEYYLYVNTD